MSLPIPRKDSVAIVTGASSGIGEQFARQLSALGHRVALTARREDRLTALAAELGGPDRAVVIAADLSVPEDRDRLAARIEELGAQVDILVNSAGFGVYGAFIESGREREVRQVRVDVEAVVDLMARYLPGMVERGTGVIINVSSSSGFLPSAYNAGYAAAKAHVLYLSEAVNAEVRGTGVSVTAVCPGPVPTEFAELNEAAIFDKVPKSFRVSPERVVADSLKAADKGKRSVVPGGPHVKAFFAPSRLAPPALALALTKRLLKK
ncbi:SDR family NAD(P)-dependent oxidoreductase [Antrihabitans stalactiti]|jgi:uncharacterized protein|uniref:SDR family oxidoreductase n=1 Tax=Antrihabitans stalactiti TaxID=2584121 RepID=A0A848KHI9_9NOCA|nr:SDR family oxidoreductase [Antrihabitans stalactiti]NMN95377.1 SDR family oxidoreductase [Antrihabitans stalactiti]